VDGGCIPGSKILFSPILPICGLLPHEVGSLFRGTIYPTANVQKKRNPSDGLQRKNAEVRFMEPTIAGIRLHQAGFRPFYFQSLKISSNAISTAVFRLFSIMLKICASNVDCFFFFFFFLSLSYWLI
jgi:hypothetical protein